MYGTADVPKPLVPGLYLGRQHDHAFQRQLPDVRGLVLEPREDGGEDLGLRHVVGEEGAEGGHLRHRRRREWAALVLPHAQCAIPPHRPPSLARSSSSRRRLRSVEAKRRVTTGRTLARKSAGLRRSPICRRGWRREVRQQEKQAGIGREVHCLCYAPRPPRPSPSAPPPVPGAAPRASPAPPRSAAGACRGARGSE